MTHDLVNWRGHNSADDKWLLDELAQCPRALLCLQGSGLRPRAVQGSDKKRFRWRGPGPAVAFKSAGLPSCALGPGWPGALGGRRLEETENLSKWKRQVEILAPKAGGGYYHTRHAQSCGHGHKSNCYHLSSVIGVPARGPGCIIFISVLNFAAET